MLITGLTALAMIFPQSVSVASALRSTHGGSDAALSRVAITWRVPPPSRATTDQIVTGWMGSVLLGFVAWRVFDEPDGQHSKVRDDWGYTPRAMTALSIGSCVGATLGIWLRGRARGNGGSLAATAAGVALATVPVMLGRDDPLLPLMLVAAWAPLQGYVGYTAYRLSAPVVLAVSDTSGPAEPAVAARPTRGRRDEVIDAEEMRRSSARSVYEAVTQLRPHWITAGRLRSPTEREGGGEAGTLAAYLDGTHYGTLESLRNLPLAGVQEVRYYNARDATNRFGTGHPAGAIDVRLAR